MTYSGPHVDLVCTDRGQHPERLLGVGYILDGEARVDLVTNAKDRGAPSRRWVELIGAPLVLRCSRCRRNTSIPATDAHDLIAQSLGSGLGHADVSRLP